MKRIIAAIIFAVILVPLLRSGSGERMNAQCTYENNAFRGSETILYNLYFNWQFIWLKAGTASMITSQMPYNGSLAYRTSLVTKTSKTIDRYFRMRDTIMVYFSPELTPLYYRKGADEGKRYYVDEVWYTYPGGKCLTTLRHLTADGKIEHEKHLYDRCVSDMLNSFQRVRNLDPRGWKNGHVVKLDIAGGDKLVQAKLVYRGKKTVKADNDRKYSCLVLSYVEPDDGKDKEIVRFFVTDDHRHIPVRLDLFLKFGSAKAFLSYMK
jgi:hypothetical protein